MGLAERADTLVDFSNLPAGTVKVRMINTAPDAPFGGFPDIPADPGTTGQVMEFALVTDTAVGDNFTAPQDLELSLPDQNDPANTTEPFEGARDMALLEEESELVCATVSLGSGTVIYDKKASPDPANPGTCLTKKDKKLAKSVPFAPKAAVLGINGSTANPTVTLWADPLQTNPAINSTETWELWNHTVDGHPIHLHLVKFKVVNREAFDPLTGALSGVVNPPEATEAGWKDTVIAYPGEVTRVNATFDIEGLYVWHCHIVEHEDNEMMVPYCVGDKATAPGCNVVP
jgi:FtsP/CotA-like multicopper oxidase with cupredoxin domain